jgi:D-alanyl-D-alanine carboxypeptidase (penicillin-binding protein 5/6)
VLVLALVGVAVFAFTSSGGGTSSDVRHARADPAAGGGGTAIVHAAHRPPPRPEYGRVAAPPSERVQVRLKRPPRSAILFDVDTGRVLWSYHPGIKVPIASLTKMMTSVIVNDRAGPHEHVKITPEVLNFSGSGVGVLPKGKKVMVEPLLYGLLLPSGNDAAIALALKVSGTQRKFVGLMNRTARDMGLGCSHYASPSGIVDKHNYSCTSDLAVLTRAILRRPRLARIVRTRQVQLPFPIKSGKLFLYNNNPLLVQRYPGTDGIKTGYTEASGPCLVSTVRRGRFHLGVVMLNSIDPRGQTERLYAAGFAAMRKARRG